MTNFSIPGTSRPFFLPTAGTSVLSALEQDMPVPASLLMDDEEECSNVELKELGEVLRDSRGTLF